MNPFITNYLEKNPFDFQKLRNDYEQKFFEQNTYNWTIELEEVFEQKNGIYSGEVKKDTRIHHGRGIFIDKINGSVYEGLSMMNKREIYGRLI